MTEHRAKNAQPKHSIDDHCWKPTASTSGHKKLIVPLWIVKLKSRDTATQKRNLRRNEKLLD